MILEIDDNRHSQNPVWLRREDTGEFSWFARGSLIGSTGLEIILELAP